MITFKTLTVEELKKDYLERHGFVFKGNTKSSGKAIETLCDTLVQFKITMEHP